ncbi:MAG: hypothetical protein EOO44_16910 [Flavobacterium sp.]|jgi:hypothetical protein|nr:MAG: hypothetical protein EOO44_16910 [Flavobacterium sp.]
MLKSILKLEGAHELTVNEQKALVGGNAPVCEQGSVAKRCSDFGEVKPYWTCVPLNYSGPC